MRLTFFSDNLCRIGQRAKIVSRDERTVLCEAERVYGNGTLRSEGTAYPTERNP